MKIVVYLDSVLVMEAIAYLNTVKLLKFKKQMRSQNDSANLT